MPAIRLAPNCARTALIASAVLLSLAAAPLAAQGASGNRFTLGGSSIAIYDLIGSVRVIGGGNADVVVDVARGGGDGAKLQVQTGQLSGRQTLRVVFPGDRFTYPKLESGWGRTEMHVREDGTFGDDLESRGRRVRITSGGDGVEAWADLTVTVPTGRTVALYIGVGSATVTNVNGRLSVDAGSADVTTTGTRGSLELDTGSGEVQVTDAEGEVNLDTGSGSVTLDRVRGPRLTVDAGSGRLTGSALTVDELLLDLGSGGTRLRGVSAKELILDSGSGSVDIALTSDVERLKVESGSGSVTLRIPAILGADVSIDTGSGGIDSEVPITVRRRTRSALVGTIGDGKGRIDIDSGSGSVRLLRAP